MKNVLIAITLLLLVGGFVVVKNRFSPKKQVANLNQVEKKIGKDLGLKEEKTNLPSYPKAKINEDKCGEDAFYVEEKALILSKIIVNS